MPSPQDVLEAAIPHPSDSTPTSRTDAAKRVMQALELNGYFFMRRRKPLDARHDGECSACGCDMAYVQHPHTFMDASHKLAQQNQTLAEMAQFLAAIASGTLPLPEIQAIAKRGLGLAGNDNGVILPSARTFDGANGFDARGGTTHPNPSGPANPPNHAHYQSPEQSGTVFITPS